MNINERIFWLWKTNYRIASVMSKCIVPTRLISISAASDGRQMAVHVLSRVRVGCRKMAAYSAISHARIIFRIGFFPQRWLITRSHLGLANPRTRAPCAADPRTHAHTYIFYLFFSYRRRVQLIYPFGHVARKERVINAPNFFPPANCVIYLHFISSR